MELDEFFLGFEGSRPIFEALEDYIEQLDPVILRITKSQIAFYHRRAFAWAWIPSRYLPRATAPLVLSLSLHRRDPSTRWKEIVEPAAGHFMHHLELFSVDQLDVQLLGWLQEAFILAG